MTRFTCPVPGSSISSVTTIKPKAKEHSYIATIFLKSKNHITVKKKKLHYFSKASSNESFHKLQLGGASIATTLQYRASNNCIIVFSESMAFQRPPVT